MSNTRYSRTRVMRFDAAETRLLNRCLMYRIETCPPPPQRTGDERAELRELRDLLERMTQPVTNKAGVRRFDDREVRLLIRAVMHRFEQRPERAELPELRALLERVSRPLINRVRRAREAADAADE